MRSIILIVVGIAFVADGNVIAQLDTKSPKTAHDFYERGRQRQEAKLLKEAVEDYSKAANLDPELYDAHFSLSAVYAELKDYRGAVDALANSLKIRPKAYSSLFNSGLYHEYLRDYDGAIAFYTQASADDADFSCYGGSKEEARAHAFHYRGRVYQWHKKDKAQAVSDYSLALGLDPEIEMVLYRRAVAYHDLKDYANASDDFAAAWELDPNYPNLLNAWAWQLATCPDAKFRNGQLALKLATKANDKRAMAAAYAEIGDFDTAVAFQKRAIEQRDLLLDELSEPKDGVAASRRSEKKGKLQMQLEAYEAKRPYRDE